VYYFPGQVGQGKIKWEDAASHALLRDKVLGNWPKDDTGWPKTLSKEDEAAYVGGLVAEERHAVSGLGGSQKAEVAWLDYHNIPYKEVDVLDFIEEDPVATPQAKGAKKPSLKSGQKVAPVHPTHEEDGGDTTEEELLAETTAESSVKDANHASDHELEIDQLSIDELQPPLTQGVQIKDPNPVIDIEYSSEDGEL
jgi:hypothetical protein